jgi:hypothetical protein
MQLAVVVTNAGNHAGATPVQLFFRCLVAAPVRIASIQLVRFSKTSVMQPGATERIEFELAPSDFEYWDDGRNGTPGVEAAGGWAIAPGDVELVVATAGYGSWDDPTGLKTTIKISN